jgi:hypothetical protein
MPSFSGLSLLLLLATYVVLLVASIASRGQNTETFSAEKVLVARPLGFARRINVRQHGRVLADSQSPTVSAGSEILQRPRAAGIPTLASDGVHPVTDVAQSSIGDAGRQVTGRHQRRAHTQAIGLIPERYTATVSIPSTASVSNRSTATERSQSTATARNQSTATERNQSTATARNQSTATVGNQSTATARNQSTATVGNQSTATVGNLSTSTVGNLSTSTVGKQSTSTVGNLSTAIATKQQTSGGSNPSTATTRNPSTATTRNPSTATVSNASTATAGNQSTATAGNQSTATAGNQSTATAGNQSTATSKTPPPVVTAPAVGSSCGPSNARGRMLVGADGACGWKCSDVAPVGGRFDPAASCGLICDSTGPNGVGTYAIAGGSASASTCELVCPAASHERIGEGASAKCRLKAGQECRTGPAGLPGRFLQSIGSDGSEQCLLTCDGVPPSDNGSRDPANGCAVKCLENHVPDPRNRDRCVPACLANQAMDASGNCVWQNDGQGCGTSEDGFEKRLDKGSCLKTGACADPVNTVVVDGRCVPKCPSDPSNGTYSRQGGRCVLSCTAGFSPDPAGGSACVCPAPQKVLAAGGAKCLDRCPEGMARVGGSEECTWPDGVACVPQGGGFTGAYRGNACVKTGCTDPNRALVGGATCEPIPCPQDPANGRYERRDGRCVLVCNQNPAIGTYDPSKGCELTCPAPPNGVAGSYSISGGRCVLQCRADVANGTRDPARNCDISCAADYELVGGTACERVLRGPCQTGEFTGVYDQSRKCAPSGCVDTRKTLSGGACVWSNEGMPCTDHEKDGFAGTFRGNVCVKEGCLADFTASADGLTCTALPKRPCPLEGHAKTGNNGECESVEIRSVLYDNEHLGYTWAHYSHFKLNRATLLHAWLLPEGVVYNGVRFKVTKLTHRFYRSEDFVHPDYDYGRLAFHAHLDNGVVWQVRYFQDLRHMRDLNDLTSHNYETYGFNVHYDTRLLVIYQGYVKVIASEADLSMMSSPPSSAQPAFRDKRRNMFSMLSEPFCLKGKLSRFGYVGNVQTYQNPDTINCAAFTTNRGLGPMGFFSDQHKQLVNGPIGINGCATINPVTEILTWLKFGMSWWKFEKGIIPSGVASPDPPSPGNAWGAGGGLTMRYDYP